MSDALWGNWYLIKRIGSGSSGDVYIARKTEYNRTYYSAVKHISIPPKNLKMTEILAEGLASEKSIAQFYDRVRDDVIKEINICYELRGYTNIVSYEDYCIIPKAPTGTGYDIFIRMELLKSLQLKANEPWSEADVLKLGMDLCAALSVLKKKGIVHRDIKPANVFFNDEGNYKLGDFGESKVIEGLNQVSTVRGNYAYMAPEVYAQRSVDTRTDIYSVGLLMYHFLNNNRMPFLNVYTTTVSSNQIEEAKIRRFRGDRIPPPVNCIYKALSDAILRACEFDPRRRWQSPEEFYERLNSLSAEREMDKTPELFPPVPPTPPVSTPPTPPVPPTAPVSTPPTPPVPPTAPVSTPTPVLTPPVPVPARKSTSSKAGFIGAIAALSAALVAVAGFLVYFLGSSSAETSSSKTEISLSEAESSIPESSISSDISSESSPESSDTSSEPSLESASESSSEASSVKKYSVTSYKNQDYESVKEDLEGQNIYVVIKRENSSSIDYGKIIDQSVSAGAEINEGSTITLTVSNGPDFDVPSGCTQVLRVTSSGTSAKMVLYTKEGSYWKKSDFSCNATVGESGVGYNYGEGKKVTPKGSFALGTVLSASRKTYNMSWQQCTSSTVIVEDVNSKYYNQIKDLSDLGSGVDYDPIGKRLTSGVNNACIFIEHNGTGYSSYGVESGKGSSITICGVYGSISPTYGCIDITSDNMISLLSVLNDDKNPYIVIE